MLRRAWCAAATTFHTRIPQTWRRRHQPLSLIRRTHEGSTTATCCKRGVSRLRDHETSSDMRGAFRRAFAALIAYLRRGQPHMAPSLGYNPLLALLPRRLTDSDVDTLKTRLAQQHRAVSDVDIAVAIMAITDRLAARTDIERVRRSLFGLQ